MVHINLKTAVGTRKKRINPEKANAFCLEKPFTLQVSSLSRINRRFLLALSDVIRCYPRPNALYRIKRNVAAGSLSAILIMVIAGCAPPFPKEMLAKVDKTIHFSDLQKDPDRFQGAWVMLAGMVVETRNTKEGSSIEVLQKPQDSRGRPLQTDASGGRFIILSPEYLDAAVYHAGRLITVVGEAAGKKVQPLGEIEYRYPLVRASSMHLWEPYSSGPRFQFGIGIMHVR